MKFIISPFKKNPTEFLRSCGYAFEKESGNELAFVKRLSGYDYPKFHIYTYLAPKNSDKELIVNIHIDQKKPSYSGSHAHSGDYDGPLIEAEITRIQGMYRSYPIPNEAKAV